MATGASNADALLLLADVTKGLLEQTRKHLQIARLLGIRQAVLFVNKMDLAGYAQRAFDKVRAQFEAFATPLQFQTLDALPGSALLGDMVVERGDALPWYTGPTLLERLETLDASSERAAAGPLRFPRAARLAPSVRRAARLHGAAGVPATCWRTPRVLLLPPAAAARACARSSATAPGARSPWRGIPSPWCSPTTSISRAAT